MNYIFFYKKHYFNDNDVQTTYTGTHLPFYLDSREVLKTIYPLYVMQNLVVNMINFPFYIQIYSFDSILFYCFVFIYIVFDCRINNWYSFLERNIYSRTEFVKKFIKHLDTFLKYYLQSVSTNLYTFFKRAIFLDVKPSKIQNNVNKCRNQPFMKIV